MKAYPGKSAMPDAAKTQEGVSSASLIWNQNIQLSLQGDQPYFLVER